MVSSLKVELINYSDYSKVSTKYDTRVECSSKGSRAPTTTFALPTKNLQTTTDSILVSQKNTGAEKT